MKTKTTKTVFKVSEKEVTKTQFLKVMKRYSPRGHYDYILKMNGGK